MIMKFCLPFLRKRSHASRIYEQYTKATRKEESDFLNDPDFLVGYDEALEITPKLPSRGMLTICPAPLGNLQDITTRQHQALLQADILASSDTKLIEHLLNLLSQQIEGEFPSNNLSSFPEIDDYTHNLDIDFISRTVKNIKKSKQEKGRGLMINFNTINAEKRTPTLIKAMKSGIQVVLVSEVDSPLISDPGYYLVKESIKDGVTVETLPGGVAAIVALVSSGFPVENFFFQGHLPMITTEKLKKLRLIQKNRVTSVIYEISQNAVQTMEHIKSVFGISHRVFVVEKITSPYENSFRGSVQEVLREMKESQEFKERSYGLVSIVISPSEVKTNSNLITLDPNELVKILKTRVKTDEQSLKKLIQLITGFTNKKIKTLLNGNEIAIELLFFEFLSRELSFVFRRKVPINSPKQIETERVSQKYYSPLAKYKLVEVFSVGFKQSLEKKHSIIDFLLAFQEKMTGTCPAKSTEDQTIYELESRIELAENKGDSLKYEKVKKVVEFPNEKK